LNFAAVGFVPAPSLPISGKPAPVRRASLNRSSRAPIFTLGRAVQVQVDSIEVRVESAYGFSSSN
jgi:hypothetical protein